MAGAEKLKSAAELEMVTGGAQEQHTVVQLSDGSCTSEAQILNKSLVLIVRRRLSTLFHCSVGGTFNFCPSGNVIINVTPSVTGISVEKLTQSSQPHEFILYIIIIYSQV